MNNPYFSVIIPVFNVEKYLKQCVDSVLNQKFVDFEIILVDDGSTDYSSTICDEYVILDSRIKVFHKKNGGLSDARNFGLKQAKGKYVLFLDSDDFWNNNDFLILAKKNIEYSDCDVLIFGMQKFYQKDNIYGEKRLPVIVDVKDKRENILTSLQNTNTFLACAWDKIYKKSFLINNDLMFVFGQLSEDIEWCIKLLINKAKISTLNECVYIYRQQNSLSISNNIRRKNLEDICGVIIHYTNLALKNNEEDILNFIANQYVLWLTVSTRVNDNIDDLLQLMKKYKFLLRYNEYPYVKKVSKVRFLSISVIRKLLNIYKKHKSKK